MRTKIKEALKQGHKNLGLSDEVFERVAASVETFITDESAIDSYVNSESTLNLLKSYQSVNDKLRALERKNVETPTPPEPINPQPAPTPQPIEQSQDLAKLIADAVAANIQPLQTRIDAFEAEKVAQTTIDAAKKEFFGQDGVKAYQGVGNSTWRNTLQKFEFTGKKWNKEEFLKELNDEFNTACTEQNLDTTKPAQGDGGSGAPHDWKAFAARREERGKIANNEA